MNNKAIIEDFYYQFSQANAEGMIAHYSDNIEFEDPAFGKLKGEDAKNMWRMLVNPGLQLAVSHIQANGEHGSAHWQATYTFSKTGRKVINDVDAEFTFKNGKIEKHTDRFSFHKWAAQALGISGFLLGWTPVFHKKVTAQALERLSSFSEKRS